MSDINRLSGLKPESVFAYFESICSIPHGSHNTKKISDYLVSFAQKHGLCYTQDELNNVVIFQEGTCGMEDRPPVIIQGHMDMVCQQDVDCTIDMENEGLDVTHDGSCVFANGTTLGGDDGIALAYALALLADTGIPHPPLEVVFTVDEEIGMEGATGIDLSKLKGRRLINIDSEEEGVFTVACAGGARVTLELPLERRAVYGPCIRLTVEGLQGGHSGVEIHKNRANATKVMGELLSRIQKLMPLCITKLSGGTQDNAIPRSCTVTLVAMGSHIERINEITEQLQQEIRQVFDEPEVRIYGDDVDAFGGNALSTQLSAQVIALLCSVPNGIQSWSKDIPGLVQTSLNLGVTNMEKEKLSLTFAVRSSVNQEKVDLLEQLKELARLQGCTYSDTGNYPAWEYVKDSALRDTMVEVYTKIFGKEPEVVAIHAGLECGILSDKLPGLECVSIGPQMHDIHTSRERLEIASTERTWNFLLETLKAL
jgi:dipeptidase D